MNILAIETTAAFASTAIYDNDECVHEVVSDGSLTHLQKLIPLVDKVLEECDMKLSEMDGIAVSRGPGSFTGIRIGVATAKALAQALNIKVAQVPTLQAMAMNMWDFEGIVCPVLDARRNQLYSAAYVMRAGEAEELYPEGAYYIDEIVDKLKAKGAILFMGDALNSDTIKAELVERLEDQAMFASPERRLQTAFMVAVLGAEIHKAGNAVTYAEVRPEYLRKSEAERNLELKKCQKKQKE